MNPTLILLAVLLIMVAGLAGLTIHRTVLAGQFYDDSRSISDGSRRLSVFWIDDSSSSYAIKEALDHIPHVDSHKFQKFQSRMPSGL